MPKYLKYILQFILVILISVIILPNFGLYFRPNILLVFLILLTFLLSFKESLFFWIISGIILDTVMISKIPLNSFVFILFFILQIPLSNIFDLRINMSKLIVGILYIFIYYFIFIIYYFIPKKSFNGSLVVQFIETAILFLICFKFIKLKKENEKLF